MISCHALVALLCPFVCSHLNISPFEWYSKCCVPTSTSHLLSDTASVEPAALSSLYVPFMCCFARFVCWNRCGLVLLIKVGLCSIISPTQASKALLFARATATVDAIVPFKVPLTSVRLNTSTSDLFSRRFIKRFLSGILLPCHVLFQDCWGVYIVVYLGVFQYSTSKGLRRKMLFLCPLLVPLPCSFEGSKCFIHKTLAYLFLRVCWAIFTKYYFHSWRGFRRKTLYVFCHALVPLLCPLVSKCQ